MKSIKLLIGLAFVSSAVSAQTGYDAQRFAEKELNGTARFVGMGGAMGALGADISVIGTNPAGIALFRRNDVSTSFGFNTTIAKSDFAGVNMKEKHTAGSFDQAGFVYAMKIGNRSSLRYMNFGFNYHKRNNFNRDFSAGGFLDGLSQTNQMAAMMDEAFYVNDISGVHNEMDAIFAYDGKNGTNPYLSNKQYPYLGLLGVRTDLVTKGLADVEDGSGNIKTIEVPMGWNGDQNYYFSHEEGGIYQYDFNVSFNVQDKMYFGLTLGVHDVDYKRFSSYTEDIFWEGDKGFYELRNFMRTEGTGIDLKLGAIFRPIEDSPFRFGFAVHTPTWYELTDFYDSDIYSEITYEGETKPGVLEDYVSDNVDGEVMQDYKLMTPWKFNLNMGTVVAGTMALGAEYEYTDYSTSKLRYIDGYDMDNQNQYMKEDLKGVHTFRVGMETRVSNAFSIRAGYNFSSSVFKDNAYKALNWNDMRSDVDYNNKFEQNTFTVGLGYRSRIFYVDAAYKYNMYKSDFYSFSDELLKATKVDNERHQLLVTLGARF